MFKNTSVRYGVISIVLHWLTAITVIGLFALGFWMIDLHYYHSWYRTAPHIHKSIGILLFIAMTVRLLWRCYSPVPGSLASHQPWEKQVSRLTHWLLYLLIFTIMLTGYLISTSDGRAIQVFGWFEVPSLGELFSRQSDIAGDLHKWLAYSLIGLVVLHAVAALKHHFMDKDATLLRMFGRHKDN
ncbi:MAG: cytochrome b [Alkalimonas sp.]|nr:cytochrome b [Alkalimonas sp.]